MTINDTTGFEEQTCSDNHVHAAHIWNDLPYPGYVPYWCLGVMLCPVQSWNAHADEIKRYETALHKINTLSDTQDGAIDMRRVARKALGLE